MSNSWMQLLKPHRLGKSVIADRRLYSGICEVNTLIVMFYIVLIVTRIFALF
jgi:hypothetical protein